MEAASRICNDEYFRWFVPIWTDITGASTREHPAPYPVSLAYRLVRMFSFAGDTVLDPYLGTGTTTHAAMLAARNSIGMVILDSRVLLRGVGCARLTTLCGTLLLSANGIVCQCTTPVIRSTSSTNNPAVSTART
jgi:hypothetical protein